MIEESSYVLIVYKDKRYFKKMEPGKSFHGTGGVINFSDLIGTEYGVRYGHYEIFEPTMEDIIMYGLRRETQIVYPKEAYHICFKLNLKIIWIETFWIYYVYHSPIKIVNVNLVLRYFFEEPDMFIIFTIHFLTLRTLSFNY